ncbi:MAG: hypothetical protein COU90_01200 [Candidatus Ryanbacteria bacterium CG10_big_fil_rev_8_21_14_0_10_43_42]|uniref:Uncharacterized protein n=1 Tax=Candidatus Ryanbacteria bacterium CG10_big_fil_rev_8_21_14_0_10_43_42 TaxID=1974864 RepID=A0A2M8KY54_9BACT|nr:MAG: hypothetical protein COU90_01200 [Candidatus Ryanbacteria bacterium CG10_big_fil_rev_8_21_14_0_10_43_42]
MSMTKGKKIFLGIVISIVVILTVLLLLALFYPLIIRFTPYFKTCNKVQVGMTQEEAFNTMKPYEKYTSGKGFLWEYTGETEYNYGTNNGAQCRIFVKDGKVSRVAFEAD